MKSYNRTENKNALKKYELNKEYKVAYNTNFENHWQK